MTDKNIKSDAEAYFKKNPEIDCYLNFFFSVCRKYGISYASANEQQREAIIEVVRYAYETDKAEREDRPASDVKPVDAKAIDLLTNL